MSKKLFNILSLAALLTFSSAASSTVISVDVELSGKSESGFIQTPTDFQQTRNDFTDITPVYATLDYQVDFDNAGPVRGVNNPDSSYYSFLTELEPNVPVGPFYDQLMALVDPSAYTDTFEYSEFFINAFISHEPGFGPGYEGMQISYQLSGQTSSIANGIETIDSYSYFSYFYIPVSTVNSFDEFTLTSVDAIRQALFDNQGGIFNFGEQMSIRSEQYDVNTFDWISTVDETIEYFGNATFSVTNAVSVSEPAAPLLLLLGLGAVLTGRRRPGK